MDVKLPPDFKEFLRLLNAHEVEYLLVGGYAVTRHGYPRATQDLDVWIRVSPENARRIVLALRAFGFDQASLTPELFLSERAVTRLGRPPLRIEIVTSISGVRFDECVPLQVESTFDDVEVPTIGREDLLQNKRAAGRPKDLADVAYLTQSRRRGRR